MSISLAWSLLAQTIADLLRETLRAFTWYSNTNPLYFSNVCIINSSLLDKMAAISQTIFSDAFSWMKSFWCWLRFHWSLFLRVKLTINQHWFRYLSEPMLTRFSDAYMRHYGEMSLMSCWTAHAWIVKEASIYIFKVHLNLSEIQLLSS